LKETEKALDLSDDTRNAVQAQAIREAARANRAEARVAQLEAAASAPPPLSPMDSTEY